MVRFSAGPVQRRVGAYKHRPYSTPDSHYFEAGCKERLAVKTPPESRQAEIKPAGRPGAPEAGFCCVSVEVPETWIAPCLDFGLFAELCLSLLTALSLACRNGGPITNNGSVQRATRFCEQPFYLTPAAIPEATDFYAFAGFLVVFYPIAWAIQGRFSPTEVWGTEDGDLVAKAPGSWKWLFVGGRRRLEVRSVGSG